MIRVLVELYCTRRGIRDKFSQQAAPQPGLSPPSSRCCRCSCYCRCSCCCLHNSRHRAMATVQDALLSVEDAMNVFRSAASQRGAYAEQCQAAEELLELAPVDALLLEELQQSLQRLLTNVASCVKRRRLDAKSGARTQAAPQLLQKRLATARSRAIRRLRAAHAASSPSRACTPSPTAPAAAAPAAAAQCPLLATHGPRHLCESYCYYREHEPTRRLHGLRLQLFAHGVSAEAAAGWRVEPRLRTPRPKRARQDKAEGQGRGQGQGQGQGRGREQDEGEGAPAQEATAAAEWRVVFVSGLGTEYATQAAALRAAAHTGDAAHTPAATASHQPSHLWERRTAAVGGEGGGAGGAAGAQHCL